MLRTEKKKIERTATKETLADVLAEVMQGVTSESIAIDGEAVPIDSLENFELSAKQKDGRYRIKAKIKYTVQGEAPRVSSKEPESTGAQEFSGTRTAARTSKKTREGTTGKPKYKHLKERMKSDFKEIRAELNSGVVPKGPIVADFERDCRLMCEYSGKGDEYYERFLKAADTFFAALTVDDLQAARDGAEELDRLKHLCHDKYE